MKYGILLRVFKGNINKKMFTLVIVLLVRNHSSLFDNFYIFNICNISYEIKLLEHSLFVSRHKNFGFLLSFPFGCLFPRIATHFGPFVFFLAIRQCLGLHL